MTFLIVMASILAYFAIGVVYGRHNMKRSMIEDYNAKSGVIEANKEAADRARSEGGMYFSPKYYLDRNEEIKKEIVEEAAQWFWVTVLLSPFVFTYLAIGDGVKSVKGIAEKSAPWALEEKKEKLEAEIARLEEEKEKWETKQQSLSSQSSSQKMVL